MSLFSHLAPREVEPPGSRSQVQPGNENTEAPPQGARCEFCLMIASVGVGLFSLSVASKNY